MGEGPEKNLNNDGQKNDGQTIIVKISFKKPEGYKQGFGNDIEEPVIDRLFQTMA
jgi:hypothetical protein